MNNLEILEEITGTQYNDNKGLISIDFHDPSYFSQLCRDNEIDTAIYLPIGFGFMYGDYKSDILTCRVLLLDRRKYGRTFDGISQQIKSLKMIDVIQKSFDIKYMDLFKYIKRIDFMTLSKISENINSLNICESD